MDPRSPCMSTSRTSRVYPRLLNAALGLVAAVVSVNGCESSSKKGRSEDDAKAAKASSPAEQACAKAETEGSVLAWLRVRAEHPEAPCANEIDGAIAKVSAENSKHADDTSTPTVLIDGDGIWLAWRPADKPTIPHPPGSTHDFAALGAEAKKYKQLFPHESVARVWAADDVPPVDLLRTVETLRGQGCKIAPAEPDKSTRDDQEAGGVGERHMGRPRSQSKSALYGMRGPKDGIADIEASDECLFWRAVLLDDRPEIKPPDPPPSAEEQHERLRCADQQRRHAICKQSCIDEAPESPDRDTLISLCIRMECPGACEPKEAGR